MLTSQVLTLCAGTTYGDWKESVTMERLEERVSYHIRGQKDPDPGDGWVEGGNDGSRVYRLLRVDT